MNNIFVKNLGLQPYLPIYEKMHKFTQERDSNTSDEIWFLEHPSTFTQGKVGKAEHLLQQSDIPIIQTDRGGQITYHGQGQQIMYILLDLRRLKIGIRDTVSYIENSVINLLSFYGVKGYAKPDAPGVYVDNKKICSLGLHISHGCTLHGLALNVDMDLTPFNYINPCGYAGLQMTQLKEYVDQIDREQINKLLADNFISQLPFSKQVETQY